eukprot:2545300-Amphidinium_carterae.1
MERVASNLVTCLHCSMCFVDSAWSGVHGEDDAPTAQPCAAMVAHGQQLAIVKSTSSIFS